MRRSVIYLAIFLFWAAPLSSQNISITGTVYSTEDNESLPAVTVSSSNGSGTITDENGRFELSLPEGDHTLSFSFIGFRTQEKSISVGSGNAPSISIYLIPMAEELTTTVVSTSKYEKKLEEETISMSVIDGQLMEESAIIDAAVLVEKVPGVNVIDGQASIRGGSGYAFGVGSRTLLVVDGQPLLTADRSDAKWDFVPIENIDQIEVVKGASSVQYGSAALNGIIHVRTGYATDKPQTEITSYMNLVGGAPNSAYEWWSRTDTSAWYKPGGLGIYGSHKRKIGRWDLVVGGLMHHQQSHLREEQDDRLRFNFKLRHRPEKFPNLNYGVNGNIFYRNGNFFFFWDDSDSNAYVGSPGTSLEIEDIFMYVDPFMNIFDNAGNKHTVKGRYFLTQDLHSDPKPTSHLLSIDYQFHRTFDFGLSITTGANNAYYQVIHKDLGNHQGNLGGLYLQPEYKIGNLTVASGGRIEYYRLDDDMILTPPVFRLGLNYKLGKHNFLRAGIGQAFRIPSIAEKFVDDQRGEIVIYPNNDLEPEKGYTAEIGYKHVLETDGWAGYVDAAVFLTDFDDMVEFTFGAWGNLDDPIFGLGFKSVNISDARILGLELEASGNGSIGSIPLSGLVGYTYLYPAAINLDSSQQSLDVLIERTVNAFNNPDSTTLYGMLNYRFRHTLKADVSGQWKKWSLGTSVKYYSFMDKIDNVFEVFISGLSTYRAEHNKGDVVLDLRLGYHFHSLAQVNVVVNNVLNRDYAIRAAKPNAPRNFTIQYKLKF